MPHADGGFGLTPNVIAQTSAKVAMASRFLGLVGSLPLDGCVVQETFTVQDPPASPSETLLLPPLKCLHKANERIQERPQPGDSRPVIPPSQRTLSRQIMRKWEPWKTNIGKSNNHRMLQQLAFHK